MPRLNRRFILLFFACLAALCGGCTLAPSSSQRLAASQTPPLPSLTETPHPTMTAGPSEAVPSQTPAATATVTPTSTPSPTRFSYAWGPTGFPEDVNPLTGLPVSAPELLDRRPMVIKVTNFPRSVRPQWGLSLADHVFEYYIGDSMSRFVGVFYGNDASRVGPIRSARIFDSRVMRMYRGSFVFGYADDPVLEFFTQPDIKNLLIVPREDNCPPLCRIGSDNAYNNLYVDTSLIGPYLTGRRNNNDRQDLEGLSFALDVPKSGNPGRVLSVQYSIVSYHRWEYNPAAGKYLRYQETIDERQDGKRLAPLTDNLTQSQLAASNVVVLLIPHTYFLKSSSTEIIDQVVEGEGQGYAFRDGLLYPVVWSHSAPNERILLTLPNGTPYPLKPGNTWYIVLSETSTLEPLAAGAWNFQFVFP